jgi:hypothetical protein
MMSPILMGLCAFATETAINAATRLNTLIIMAFIAFLPRLFGFGADYILRGQADEAARKN